jgi:predicted TIM-barrel fold metal-dependent hydrolase
VSLIDDYLAGRPAAEREAVMGGNAERFWNLRAGELV